ncbi:unnamed protein product [Amoebophrya sp. A120]|nr:unnamed protein product [Amoebophrya sp. A120]|eukprot:GSA120T00024188001.1
MRSTSFATRLGAGLLLACTPGQATTHAHGHEGQINWGATYNTPESAYFLWLEAATTDPFLVVTSTATAAIAEAVIDNDHHAVQDTAKELLHEAEDGDGCVKNVTSLLNPYDTFPPASVAASELTFTPNNTCAYRLIASSASTTVPMKLFKLDLSSASHILLFSNSSTVFSHLKVTDGEGHVIAAAHKLHEAHAATTTAAAAHDDHDHKPWGEMLLACLMVNLIAFTGVLFVAGTLLCGKKEEGDDFNTAHAKKTHENSWIAGSSAFAAGALLAAAAYFMWFEATHLIQDGMKSAEESTVVFLWGTALLVGFLLPPLASSLFQLCLGQGAAAAPAGAAIEDGTPVHNKVAAAELGGVASQDVVVEEEPMLKKLSGTLLVSVLLGDFFHNFADGIFIGAAFLTCSHTRGWIVALGAVLHEIAQEIADYLMLTGPGGLSPVKALGLNFCSGLSVMLGGVLALASDYDKVTIGLIVSFGGGTYAYLACVECMGRAVPPTGGVGAQKAADPVHALKMLGLFVLGAVLIGLALLQHEHCSGGGHVGHGGTAAAGGHAGHGH